MTLEAGTLLLYLNVLFSSFFFTMAYHRKSCWPRTPPGGLLLKRYCLFALSALYSLRAAKRTIVVGISHHVTRYAKYELILDYLNTTNGAWDSGSMWLCWAPFTTQYSSNSNSNNNTNKKILCLRYLTPTNSFRRSFELCWLCRQILHS